MKLGVVLFLACLVGVVLARPSKKEAELMKYLLREIADAEKRDTPERCVQQNQPMKRGISMIDVDVEGCVKVYPQINLSNDDCNADRDNSDCYFMLDLYQLEDPDKAEPREWTVLGYPAVWDTDNLVEDTWYEIDCCRVDGPTSSFIVQFDGSDECEQRYCQLDDKTKDLTCQQNNPLIANDLWANFDWNSLFNNKRARTSSKNH